MDDVDFESDKFEDILAKDSRYDARAYAFLMDVVHYLMEHDGHASGEDILEEFRLYALDQYGPLAFTVMTTWGVKSCSDIGEMMFNLAEGRRVAKEDGDSPESFAGGYDFKEAFLAPFDA